MPERDYVDQRHYGRRRARTLRDSMERYKLEYSWRNPLSSEQHTYKRERKLILIADNPAQHPFGKHQLSLQGGVHKRV